MNISRLCLLLLTAFQVPGYSSQSICGSLSEEASQPSSTGRLYYAYRESKNSEFDTTSQTASSTSSVSITEHKFTYRSLPTKSDNSVSWSYLHQYTILDVANSVAPQTNGHLHSLRLPVWWRGSQRNLQIGIEPALSISSNMLKNPEEIESESWQLRFAMQKFTPISKHWQWVFGLCGDYRFGDYKIYPVIGAILDQANWRIYLSFPDIEVTRIWGNGWSSAFKVEPYGSKWFVKDSQLIQSSDVVFESLLTSISISKDFSNWSLLFSLQNNSNNNLKLVLQDNSVFTSNINHFSSVNLKASWHF